MVQPASEPVISLALWEACFFWLPALFFLSPFSFQADPVKSFDLKGL